jgi:hypothetical protein
MKRETWNIYNNIINRNPVLFLFFLLISVSSYSQPEIFQYNTHDLRVIYLTRGYSYMVPHMARCYENAMDFHREFWDYTPSEEVSVLLNDFSDVGNGGTLVIPWNMLTIGIAPFNFTYNIIPTNERFQWLMNHELTHVVMCDEGAGNDLLYRKLLGGKVLVDNTQPLTMAYSYMTTPRWYSPRWYHEGIAVFMETWMSGGMGRVLGGYDEMVFRTMVHDSSYFYGVVGLETEGTTIDFQVGVNSYLYGTRFVSYLAYHYGVDKLRDFYSRSDSSRRFYASQFKNVYGVDIKNEWDRWIDWEHGFQEGNLKRIREYEVTPVRYVTGVPLGSISNSFIDSENNVMYAAVNYPGKPAHIAAIDLSDGNMRPIKGLYSPVLYYVTSLAYEDSSKLLFATTHTGDWRGLESIDTRTGERKKLIKITRAGDLVINPVDKSLWALQHMNGRVTIIRIPPPYTKWEDVYTIAFGRSFFDIDISHDGKYLSGILSDVSGHQKLIIYPIRDLLLGDEKFEELYEFEENAISNFKFSDDGRYLYGTSWYTGVSNVFRVNVETHQSDLITNAETGFFRPIQFGKDSLLVFEYHQNGLQPCIIPIQTIDDANAVELLGQLVYETNPVVEEWMLPPPSKINIDSLKTYEGRYSPFKELRFATAYPVIEGYKDFMAFGYRFNFMDPSSLHTLKMSVLYSPELALTPMTPEEIDSVMPDKQRIHANLEYRLWGWTLNASYNKTDFYDLFGPTKVSRAGYAITLRYQKILKHFRPDRMDFSFQAGAYGDLEKLPSFQEIDAPYKNMYTAIASFHYSHLIRSLGAVEAEKGFEWTIYTFNYFAGENIFPHFVSNQDIGFLLPVRNTSFWLRSSVGQSFGDRTNNLSKFYFGGFRNNWVDYQALHRYREFLSFPGVMIDQIDAKNYGKLMAELNLQPLRFKRLGFLGFYATYARLSLFTMGLFTDLADPDFRKIYYNTGAQLDIEVALFTLLKSYLSFGYARGFNENMEPSDQWMISLKLM